MIHLTFQIVSAIFSIATAAIYFWLIRREISKRHSLECEIESLSRSLTYSEKTADQWASKYSRARLDNGHLESRRARLEEEVQRLQGLLMAKQGASDN